MKTSDYDYEKIATNAIDDAVESCVECPNQWHWAYFLGKALVYALLYIGTSIRENKNV